MKLVIDCPFVKVELKNGSLVPYIILKDKGWVEMMPFGVDAEGYAAALMQAADVMAGKFFPNKFVTALPGEKDPNTEAVKNSLLRHTAALEAVRMVLPNTLTQDNPDKK